MKEANDLTHFSDSGRARMVDVSDKSATRRGAASGVGQSGLWRRDGLGAGASA